jgi:MFS family permease
LTKALRRGFTPLEIPNYRRYFAGQLVSLSGNWMQMVGEVWLILSLTGSGVAVGVTTALQFLPILLIGAWAGAVADRLDKRSVLLVTQTLMAAPALALWALTASDAIAPWMVYALVFVRGSVNAIDYPTRQSFVIEIVGGDRVVRAVGLNSVLIHSARILGPAAAGVAIATVGVATCFLLNAASFAAMLVALRGMDPEALRPAERADGADRGVGAALAYVARTPGLAIPLAMMAVVGTLGFNFQVVLPLLARFTFDGGATAYTELAVAMGVGSIVGALATAARGRVGPGLLVAASFAFGTLALIAAAAPSLPLAAIALALLGVATVTFAAGINSTLQLGARPDMRGRVMALFSVVFVGSTPIGGPLTGWLSEAAGPRAALLLAAGAALAAAGGAAIAFSRTGWAPELSLAGGRGRRRLRHRGAVAVEPRGADQLHGLEGRGGLDVEPDSVTLLDRGHGGLSPAPHEGHEDRVAGADRGHLRPHPCEAPDDQREGADRPQTQERDPARALGRQAGPGARRGERPGHRLGGAGSAADHESDRGRDHPPGAAHDQGQALGVTVGDRHGDGPKDRRDRGNQQHGQAQ